MASLVMDAILALETGGLKSQILLSCTHTVGRRKDNFKRLQMELSTEFAGAACASGGSSHLIFKLLHSIHDPRRENSSG